MVMTHISATCPRCLCYVEERMDTLLFGNDLYCGCGTLVRKYSEIAQVALYELYEAKLLEDEEK